MDDARRRLARAWLLRAWRGMALGALAGIGAFVALFELGSGALIWGSAAAGLIFVDGTRAVWRWPLVAVLAVALLFAGVLIAIWIATAIRRSLAGFAVRVEGGVAVWNGLLGGARRGKWIEEADWSRVSLFRTEVERGVLRKAEVGIGERTHPVPLLGMAQDEIDRAAQQHGIRHSVLYL